MEIAKLFSMAKAGDWEIASTVQTVVSLLVSLMLLAGVMVLATSSAASVFLSRPGR